MPYHGVRGDFLLGLVTNGETFSVEGCVLGGCPFFSLQLPTGSLRRQIALRRGIRELEKRCVRRCVFPQNFLEQSVFTKRGVEAVSPLPLLRKKAGEWVLAERQARGLTGSVGVAADRLTEDVAEAARLLLDHLGSVSLLRMEGAEELQQRLRRESGAVLRLLPPQKLSSVETLLNFSSCSIEGMTLTLRMEEGMLPRFLLPEELRREFPVEVNDAQLATALWACGKVETKRIGLKSRM